MPAIHLHAPVLGPLGQPCGACGEPLAADQRYCLSCGERRRPARLEPLEHARGRVGAPAPPSAPPAAVTGPRRATAWPLPSRRVAGVATLLMLGFGVAAGAAAGPAAPPPRLHPPPPRRSPRPPAVRGSWPPPRRRRPPPRNRPRHPRPRPRSPSP